MGFTSWTVVVHVWLYQAYLCYFATCCSAYVLAMSCRHVIGWLIVNHWFPINPSLTGNAENDSQVDNFFPISSFLWYLIFDKSIGIYKSFYFIFRALIMILLFDINFILFHIHLLWFFICIVVRKWNTIEMLHHEELEVQNLFYVLWVHFVCIWVFIFYMVRWIVCLENVAS